MAYELMEEDLDRESEWNPTPVPGGEESQPCRALGSHDLLPQRIQSLE